MGNVHYQANADSINSNWSNDRINSVLALSLQSLALCTLKGNKSARSQPPLGNNRFFVDFLSREQGEGKGGDRQRTGMHGLESGHKIRSIYGRNIFYWNRDTISRVWEIYPKGNLYESSETPLRSNLSFMSIGYFLVTILSSTSPF